MQFLTIFLQKGRVMFWKMFNFVASKSELLK